MKFKGKIYYIDWGTFFALFGMLVFLPVLVGVINTKPNNETFFQSIYLTISNTEWYGWLIVVLFIVVCFIKSVGSYKP